MTASNAASYKARKEAFVSNLSGGSITEINLVTLVAASAILLWTALQKRHSFFQNTTSPISVATDFLLNVCAILFAITAYAGAPLFLSILLIGPAVLLLLPLQPPNRQPKASSRKVKQHGSTSADVQTLAIGQKLVVRPFLTHYRGAMLVVTALAILAVDFPIFPRRFAKVETWGTSLMDLGVGSFVFSAGVVSARAVIKQTQVTNAARPSWTSLMIGAVRHSIPLFILGFIRLWSVKGLDYAEHVTEYGVHWNFFFTLALLPPFALLSDSIVLQLLQSYDILAVIIAVVYEVVLNNTNLLSYILISPRGPDLLSKNREGVFSFIGYLSIFLAGRGTGTKVTCLAATIPPPASSLSSISSQNGGTTPTKPTPSKTLIDATTHTDRERKVTLRTLAIRSAIYILLYNLTTNYTTGLNLLVSRRLANLPYVLWIAAFNNGQLLLFGVIEHFGPAFSYLDNTAEEREARTQHATSRIMRVFNQNGLAIFLVANLLTGLVNLSVNTLDMSNAGAMGVLIAYAAGVTAFALGLDFWGIKVKL